LHSFFAL